MMNYYSVDSDGEVLRNIASLKECLHDKTLECLGLPKIANKVNKEQVGMVISVLLPDFEANSNWWLEASNKLASNFEINTVLAIMASEFGSNSEADRVIWKKQ